MSKNAAAGNDRGIVDAYDRNREVIWERPTIGDVDDADASTFVQVEVHRAIEAAGGPSTVELDLE
ncbi:MAG TPA: hypothetical protein PK156_42060 [Polyangium sp.]|nr:hypothetical protein [Polyangium sp.]